MREIRREQLDVLQHPYLGSLTRPSFLTVRGAVQVVVLDSSLVSSLAAVVLDGWPAVAVPMLTGLAAAVAVTAAVVDRGWLAAAAANHVSGRWRGRKSSVLCRPNQLLARGGQQPPRKVGVTNKWLLQYEN